MKDVTCDNCGMTYKQDNNGDYDAERFCSIKCEMEHYSRETDGYKDGRHYGN